MERSWFEYTEGAENENKNRWRSRLYATRADAPQQPMKCADRLAIKCCTRKPKQCHGANIQIIGSANVQRFHGSKLSTGCLSVLSVCGHCQLLPRERKCRAAVDSSVSEIHSVWHFCYYEALVSVIIVAITDMGVRHIYILVLC